MHELTPLFIVLTLVVTLVAVAILLRVGYKYIQQKAGSLTASLGAFLSGACQENVSEGTTWGYGLQSEPDWTNWSGNVGSSLYTYLITACTNASALLCQPLAFVAPPGFDASTLKRLYTKAGEVAGFVVMSQSGTLLIAFHSTQTVVDTFVDLQMQQTTSSLAGISGKVHSGFYNEFQTLASQLQPLVTSSDVQRIVVTGHSLGAALCQLCAAHASAKNTNASVLCVSFASPRVGNNEFASAFNSNTRITHHRIQNVFDIVPQFPFGVGGVSTYVHTNTGYYVAAATGTASDNHGLLAYRQALGTLSSTPSS